MRGCPDVVTAHHCGLGLAGQVAARGLVKRATPRSTVARAVGGGICSSVAGYRRLPT